VSDVTIIAVIGAGTMGHGIAQVAAQAGYEVRLGAKTGQGFFSWPKA